MKSGAQEIEERNQDRLALGMKPDVQQERCYAWQNSYLGDSSCEDWTLAQCQRFVEYVWHSLFGNAALPPRVHNGRGLNVSSGGRKCLTFPRWGRNRKIVLHELAHAVLHYLKCGNVSNPHDKAFYLYRYEAHGPEFLRVLIELHHYYGDFLRKQMIASARKAKLRVARGGKWLPVPRRLHGDTSLTAKECWLVIEKPKRGAKKKRYACDAAQ